MVVLLTGASGFIGTHLLVALLAAGHQLRCAGRSAPSLDAAKLNASFDASWRERVQHVAVDFSQDLRPTDWLPHLTGVDVVINAVGILRERGTQSFEALHTRAPQALFAACAAAGVARVLQISALGADAQASSGYHQSKKAADDFLLSLPLNAVIVQPSLVFGAGGASARLFTTLAALPLIPLPGRGAQALQPVAIEDVVDAVLALLEPDDARSTTLPALVSAPAAAVADRIALLGPQAISLRQLLSQLRGAMGLPPARFLAVPLALVRATARLAGRLPGSLLDAESLQMLERGNTGGSADVARLSQLLGRAPRAVGQFIAPAQASALRLQAQLSWLLPVLRVSLAAVWIWTGIVSFGLYPVADSYALLARVGVPAAMAPLLLYGAALLDVLLGVGILLLKKRHWLWQLQLALILFYSLVITIRLPEFWLHPYGPLLKNFPMLAAIWLLLELERRAAPRRRATDVQAGEVSV